MQLVANNITNKHLYCLLLWFICIHVIELSLNAIGRILKWELLSSKLL